MRYTIERFHPAHLASLTRLLDRSFGISNPAKEDLIRWKFFDSYHHDGTINYVALDEAGNVVSQYANFPVQLTGGCHLLRAMICADMATAPEFRGRGLISQLSRRVYDEVATCADVSIGFSNDEGVKVDQNANGYGYRIVGRFSRYLKPLLWKTVTPFQLSPVDRFDVLPCQKSPLFTIHKSREYLDWRYGRKPNNDYQIYLLTQHGQFMGYVILRDSGQRCYVYDVIANTHDTAVFKQILAAMHNAILERGKRLAVYYVLANSFWRQVLTDCVLLPERFGRCNYYLTVKIHNETLAIQDRLMQAENWRLMLGDIL